MTYAVPNSKRLIIPTFQTLELINIVEIVSIQAYENYSRLQLTQDRHYTSTLTFGQIVNLLDNDNFFQCHKSFLINLNYITRYYKSGEVEMADGSKIAVARRRKEDFIEALTQNSFVY